MNEETSAGEPQNPNPHSFHIPGVPPAVIRWLQRGPYRHPLRWLALAAALCALALALPSMTAGYIRARYALPEEPRRTSFEFVALAFDGPGGAQAVSVHRFREHLAALREAGYHFIGLEDVKALIHEGRPVPRRSVLLTIDGCSPFSWSEWRRAVLQARGRAVLFVDPESRRRPSWYSLRHAVMTPHWEVGIGYWEWPRQTERRSDKTGAVVKSAIFESAQRYERLYAVQQVVQERHHRFRSNVRRPFPAPIMALAYPADDSGDRGTADFRRNLLAETATDIFDLGFVTGDFALNNRWSDARRLNRLSVPPEWTATDLVARLRVRASADFRFARRVGDLEPAAWTRLFGSVKVEDSKVVLRTEPDSPLAGLWLVGSESLSEFVAETEFSLAGGVFRFVFLAAPDESRRWELRISKGGILDLVRVEDGNAITIADGEYASDTPRHQLKLLLRGGQILTRMDGRNVFGGWVNLNETPAPGRIGVRLSALNSGPAEARLASLRISPEESVVAVCDLPSEMTSFALEWAGRHAEDLSAISPPIEKLGPGAPLVYGIESDRLFRLAARVHRWNVIPHINVRASAELETWTNDRLNRCLDGVDCDGLMLRLEDTAPWRASDIFAWARRAANALQARGMRLLVRLPDSLREQMESGGLLAAIPGVQWVAGADVPAERRRDMGVEMRVSALEAEEDLRRYYETLAGVKGAESNEVRTRVRQWRDQAEELFSAGEYEGAVSLWFDWHEAEPDQPYPLRRIGDALMRLGYRDEAVDFYRQSLERDPGNVHLAVQTAELLIEQGRNHAAADLLRIYSVIFPHSDVILLAQARRFRSHGRMEDSLALVRRAAEINPENLTAAILLAELSRDPDEQRAALARLARLAADSKHRIDILRTIYESNLLALFYSDTLLELLNSIPEKDLKENPRLAEWFSLLAPRTAGVAEDLLDRPLSAAWHMEGATGRIEAKRFLVSARPEREEFTARLIGTERWRDAFLEVELDEFNGECWLTARRSSENLVRFGMDRNQEQMFLQIWRRDGDRLALRNYHASPWKGRFGGLRLRLEVRGTAVAAFVNGRPWAHGTLPLPRDFTPGWLAVIGRAAEPGKAWVALRRVSAGPLYPCLAVTEAKIGGRWDEMAATLRAHVGHLNGVCPDWFEWGPGGELKGAPEDGDDFFRLFARYHGFRLLPRIRIAPGVAIRASDLADAAEIHRVDGFVLQFGEPPSSAMLQELSAQANAYPIDLFVWIENNRDPASSRLIGVGRSALLMPGMSAEGFPARVLTPEAALEAKDLNTTGPVMIRF